MKLPVYISLVMMAALFTGPPALPAEEDPGAKPLRLNWEAVEGAVGYEIRIKDASDRILVTTRSSSNHLEFSLPPGMYKIRIAAYNKFNKVGTVSDWQDVEVKQREAPLHLKGIFGAGVKVCIGVPFFRIMPEWDRYFGHSFAGALFNVGVFGRRGIFRFLGLEWENTYLQFITKNAANVGDLQSFTLMSGGSLFFITAWQYPVNFIVRAGGGVSYSKLSYDETLYQTVGPMTYAYQEKRTLSSSVPYYKAGASIDWRFYGNLFLEAGADYNVILFEGEPLRAIRYFCLAGVRL